MPPAPQHRPKRDDSRSRGVQSMGAQIGAWPISICFDRLAGLVLGKPLGSVGRAIKIVIPRQIMSGDPGDRDVYGAQQHTPLLRLEI